jgi:hypothetical protein
MGTKTAFILEVVPYEYLEEFIFLLVELRVRIRHRVTKAHGILKNCKYFDKQRIKHLIRKRNNLQVL